MQKTKNKLKGKNVEFLFINTFEREMEVQRMDQICKTLTSKGFDFRVLLDEKSGNDFETAKAYKVQSIPTKFIIDRNGNMRYRSEGFSGDDTFIEELETVIDIIDTPESFDMKK
jgi:thioredoxin-related protein